MNVLDDTNIFFQHKDLHSLVKIINEELERLITWFQSNRLSLNVKKTNFIISILIVVRARVTRARVRVSRQSRARRSRLASQGPRLAAGHAAKPRHVAAKPRAAKPRII